ncbi:Questin oxidase-like protein [Abortiporus biennis]
MLSRLTQFHHHLTRPSAIARTLSSMSTKTATTTSTALPPTIHQGILNIPGATPESKATVERLLEEDRQFHHCFWGKVGFHNHLSHHLLAAYDLGAPASLLQAIYDQEKRGLADIHTVDRVNKVVEEQHVDITDHDWTKYLGQDRYYANYLQFFTDKVSKLGSGFTIEQFVFSPAANGNGSNMLLRFVGGAVHPMIQTGYGVEFGSDAMVAQALAQAAVHSAFAPEVFDLHQSHSGPTENGHSVTQDATRRQPSKGRSLLSIIREVYDSDILCPVLPYDPDALLSKRTKDVLSDSRRPEEIKRISSLWVIDTSRGQQELDEKVEELLWLNTLLLAATGKPGRKPRLDFFLMHCLNVSLFVPSLLNAIPTMESKAMLLRATLPVIIMYVLVRGRPRIDIDLIMSYNDVPHLITSSGSPPKPDSSAIGNPRQSEYTNPWPEIIADVLHAPDPHTLKAIRTLYYGAQKYGTVPPGGAIGAFQLDSDHGKLEETLKGTSKLDGTLFVRAAGVVMDTLGWVSNGQKEGAWDRSALGWDDAWKNGD